MAATLVAFGATDLAAGAAADPGIAIGLSGRTPEELQAESAAAYRMFDLSTRAHGSSLVALGLLAAAVLVFAFRRDRPWAWWTMWVLPAWSAGVFVFYLVAGTDPSQPPPPPMISGPIFAVLAALILLVSAPRFFRSAGDGR